jgi:3-dehydroquinate synthase
MLLRKLNLNLMKKFSSELHFCDHLPAADRFLSAVVVYDRVLARKNSEFRAWIKQFSSTYAVEGGEKLKDLDNFVNHLKRLDKTVSGISPRSLQVVAIGGGSVGDFAGFFASIYKRGVKLIHLPTTYLSAIDSAHGGKTALNLSGGKNQIGSFYPANQVWIISDLLVSQNEAQLADARGELAKIALIDSKVWNLINDGKGLIGFKEFVKLIGPAVQAKMKVVLKDPFEESGERQILNLGHTLGHVIESRLEMSHGTAVAQGLLFALRWSEKRQYLPTRIYENIEEVLAERFAIRASAIPLKRNDVELLLRKDKKRSIKDSVNFVFVKSPGKVFVEQVELAEILNEAARQGWIGEQKRGKK